MVVRPEFEPTTSPTVVRYSTYRYSTNWANQDKQETALTEIFFHVHRISKEVVKVDEENVQAIREMPAPTDVQGLKCLCGTAQYMSRFLTRPCWNTWTYACSNE